MLLPLLGVGVLAFGLWRFVSPSASSAESSAKRTAPPTGSATLTPPTTGAAGPEAIDSGPIASLASVTGSTIEKEIAFNWVRRVRASVKIGELRVLADHPGSVLARATWRFRGLSEKQQRTWSSKARLLFERQGDTLVIRDDIPADLIAVVADGFSPRLLLEVRMPPRMAVQATTSFGDTVVSGEVGELYAEANIGTVRADRLRCAGDKAFLKTAVGDAEVSLAALPRREMKTEVGVGRASVGLPARANATVSAKTNAGAVTSELRLLSSRHTGVYMGESLTGMLNRGGPLVSVDVSTGDAHVGPASAPPTRRPREGTSGRRTARAPARAPRGG